jgi:putative glutamine amidotransferase
MSGGGRGGIVAVSAPRRTDTIERVALNAAYVRALAGVGLIPLIVPPLLDPARAVESLDVVRGLVLTGGEDVDPARYGARPHPKLGKLDAARDAVELALLAGARERGLPILAICRGIQLLNVGLGGTLYQDLPTERPGPVPHEDNQARHALRVDPDSLLGRTLGRTTASVNSRHHQAVRDLAPGLRVSATAEDGVIEGVEPADPAAPWLLGVQWHPEDLNEAALFRGFAAAVTASAVPAPR